MEKTNSKMMSQVTGQTDKHEMDGKYLTFWTDKQLFGVPITHVVQIVGMQTVTQIPEFPYYAKGVINLRGSIIPLIDARLRLGRQEAEYNERTCIIVISIRERLAGFIVDEVDSVVTITDDFISPPPQLGESAVNYILGVGTLEGGIVLLMDAHKIVGEDEIDLLTNLEYQESLGGFANV